MTWTKLVENVGTENLTISFNIVDHRRLEYTHDGSDWDCQGEMEVECDGGCSWNAIFTAGDFTVSECTNSGCTARRLQYTIDGIDYDIGGKIDVTETPL